MVSQAYRAVALHSQMMYYMSMVSVLRSHERMTLSILPLVGKSGGNGIRGDVVIKGVMLQHQQDEVTLVGIVVGGWVKDDRDQGPDVPNTNGLGVVVGNDGGLECIVSVREVECLQWSHELPLDGGKLVLE
jgi:hypothetical protein